MFAVNTAEIRWFYKGNFPMEFSTWFKSLDGFYQVQSERTDYYFCLPEETKLGIKVREGRLEVKKLTSNSGILSSKNAEGIADTWIKWSIKANESEDIEEIQRSQGDWIPVVKNRSLQKFKLNENEKLLPAIAGELPSLGANVELCNIRYLNNTYWTFGLEAFGPPTKIVSVLKNCFNHVFQNLPPYILALEQSFSYPEWLCVLPHQK